MPCTPPTLRVKLGSIHFRHQFTYRLVTFPTPGSSSEAQISGMMSASVSAAYQFLSSIALRPALVNRFIFDGYLKSVKLPFGRSAILHAGRPRSGVLSLQ